MTHFPIHGAAQSKHASKVSSYSNLPIKPKYIEQTSQNLILGKIVIKFHLCQHYRERECHRQRFGLQVCCYTSNIGIEDFLENICSLVKSSHLKWNKRNFKSCTTDKCIENKSIEKTTILDNDLVYTNLTIWIKHSQKLWQCM